MMSVSSLKQSLPLLTILRRLAQVEVLGGADPRFRKGSVSWNPSPQSSPSKVGRGPNVPLLHFLSGLRDKLTMF